MVSFFFHPDYSGSAVQAYNLSQHLRRLGAAPSILAANLSGGPAYELMDGIPVHRVPVWKSGPFQIPSFWMSAAAFFIRHRGSFDLLHAHGTLQHGIASLAGRALSKPSILKVAMADSDLAFERQGRLNGGANRIMVRRFDRYIATTGAIAAEMRARGLDERRITLIPNGVDTERFVPLNPQDRAVIRRELGFPDAPLVSCVAIINERKNIDGALRMWRGAVERGIPGHLALIGPIPEPGGPYHTTLLDYVAAHRLEGRVTFLGKRDPIVPFLQASEVFLFPSKQEGMPNSVLEAMACGLPCLVSASAGTEEIVSEGEDGYLCPADDESAFVDRLTRLLSTPALRAAMGDRARENAVSRYSLRGVADRYRELYAELLANVTPVRD